MFFVSPLFALCSAVSFIIDLLNLRLLTNAHNEAKNETDAETRSMLLDSTVEFKTVDRNLSDDEDEKKQLPPIVFQQPEPEQAPQKIQVPEKFSGKHVTSSRPNQSTQESPNVKDPVVDAAKVDDPVKSVDESVPVIQEPPKEEEVNGKKQEVKAAETNADCSRSDFDEEEKTTEENKAPEAADYNPVFEGEKPKSNEFADFKTAFEEEMPKSNESPESFAFDTQSTFPPFKDNGIPSTPLPPANDLPTANGPLFSTNLDETEITEEEEDIASNLPDDDSSSDGFVFL